MKKKTSKIKSWEYEVGFMPYGSRDDGIGVNLICELRDNVVTFYLKYDCDKFKTTAEYVKERYPDKFKEISNNLNEIFNKNKLSHISGTT